MMKSKINKLQMHSLWDILQLFGKLTTKYQDTLTFLKLWLKNPLRMGAIAPSSKYLAQEMAAHIPINSSGIILELGPGTGAVTRALLQAGISPEKLVVLEYSSVLAKNLRKSFPGVRVIEGNAINLVSLLEDENRKISSIVSSLPLRSFSKMTTLAILEQITFLLTPGSKFVQFTYSFRQNRFAALTHYRQVVSRRIWRNLPPARVDVWEVC